MKLYVTKLPNSNGNYKGYFEHYSFAAHLKISEEVAEVEQWRKTQQGSFLPSYLTNFILAIVSCIGPYYYFWHNEGEVRGQRHILTTQLLCRCLQYSVITCQALSAGWVFFHPIWTWHSLVKWLTWLCLFCLSVALHNFGNTPRLSP